jgi:cytochrome c oxidase assembly factor CtaG
MSPSPWAFDAHLLSWAIALAAGLGYSHAVRREGVSASRRQRLAFAAGLLAALVALTWPLADLARGSLTALVCQRLLLLLAVPGLLMVSLPEELAARWTRPRVVDALVRWSSRPPVAVLLVTVCAVGTLTTGAVDAAARDPLVRGSFDALLVLAGSVLWLPVVPGFPGTHRPSALGRAGYLIVQSIVPSFLAIVWIFARHPLYPAFAHSATIGGVSAILDQQLAGFVAKFATIGVLWAVAFVGLTRAHTLGAAGEDTEPLRWADVERQFERADRAQRRRNPWLPGAPPGQSDEAPPGND